MKWKGASRREEHREGEKRWREISWKGEMKRTKMELNRYGRYGDIRKGGDGERMEENGEKRGGEEERERQT